MNKISTLILLFIIVLTSCQKEISINNGTNPTPSPSPNDSIYINKVIALDTTKNAPFDTAYITMYNYDALKRVITFTYFDYNYMGHKDTSRHYIIENKNYNGNDTLPYNQITKWKDLDIYLDTSFYTYLSGSSNLIKDSTISKMIFPSSPDIFTTIFKYIQSNNLIKNIQLSYLNGAYYSRDTFLYNITTQNGNIVSQQDNSNGNNNNFICNYDTKNNPLSKSYTNPYGYAGFLSLVIGDTDNDPTFYEQKNNVVEINNTVIGGGNHYKFEYKYNVKNFPTEVTLKIISGGLFDKGINKIKFQYTN